jgi:hypothetical protein
MKRNQILFAIFAFVIAAMLTGNVNAQFGDLMNKTKSKINKAQKKTEQSTQQTSPADSNQNTKSNGGSDNNQYAVSGEKAQIGNYRYEVKNFKPGEAGFVGLSKKPVDPNNLAATEWTKNFANGDPIYGIVFLPKPLSAYAVMSNANTDKVDAVMGAFYIFGDFGVPQPGEYPEQTNLTARLRFTPEMANQKYATFVVFPDPKLKFSASEGVSGYQNVVFLENAYTKAKKYDFAIAFTIPGAPSEDDAAFLTGITIDFSNKAPYLAMKKSYNSSLGSTMNEQVVNKLLEPAVTTSPALQKQFFALAQSQLGDAKLLKLNILSPSWQVVRNEITGIITHRYMAARGIAKESEGYCRTRYVLYMQQYNGAGYGATQVNANGATDDWVIPCENAK